METTGLIGAFMKISAENKAESAVIALIQHFAATAEKMLKAANCRRKMQPFERQDMAPTGTRPSCPPAPAGVLIR